MIMCGLTYDNIGRLSHKKTLKSEGEKFFNNSAEFPDCRGLYPDCPETPSLLDKNCRTCPKTDDLKKPKLEND